MPIKVINEGTLEKIINMLFPGTPDDSIIIICEKACFAPANPELAFSNQNACSNCKENVWTDKGSTKMGMEKDIIFLCSDCFVKASKDIPTGLPN